MNANLKKIFSAVVVIGTLTSANVQAEGLIARILRDAGMINENQRRALDGAHEALGRPLDHIASQAVDVYIPGAGTAMETNWAYQRQRADQQAYYEQQRAQQAYNYCRQRGFYGYDPYSNICY